MPAGDRSIQTTASIPRRLVAAVIDGALGVLAVGPLVIAAYALAAKLSMTRGRRRGLAGPAEWGDPDKMPRWLDMRSAAVRRAWRMASLTSVIAGVGDSRGPGARLLGLRRVDAWTGEPPGRRSRLVRFAVVEGWKELSYRINGPADRRRDRLMAELEPQLDEIQRRHPHDPEARRRAMADLYKRNGSCMRIALRVLLIGLAPELPALWSARKQGVADRLAGTVVVVERQPR
jgi:RDD family